MVLNIGITEKKIGVFSFATFLIYVLCLFIVSHWKDSLFNDLILFDPNCISPSGALITLNFLIVLSGWLLVYLIPGLIWMLVFQGKKSEEGGTCLLFRSFLTSLLLLIVSTSFLKMVTRQSLTRVSFLFIIFFIICIGLYALNKTRKGEGNLGIIKINKGTFFTLSMGVIVTLLLIFVFRGKIFIENFSEGGIENFYVAESLKADIVPSGDLEGGEDNRERFGLPVSEPFWMISFLNLFNLLLLGQCEASVRLHFFLYLFMAYLLMARFIYPYKKLNVIYLNLFFIFFTVTTLFYTGHNAYFEDIAADVSLSFFLLLLSLSIYFLLNKDRVFFLITSCFFVLTMWTGLVLTPIIMLAYWMYFAEERRWFRKILFEYFVMMLALAMTYFAYGWIKGYLHAWHFSLNMEYIHEMFYSSNRLRYILVFLKYFIFLAGGLPVFALFTLKHNDKLISFLSFISLLYILVVFKSSYINLHYFAPALFLVVISFLRLTSSFKKRNYYISRAIIIFLVCLFIFISWPKRYLVHTTYRDLGQRICMVFPSFESAYWRRNISDLRFKDDMYFKQYIDIETIPYYATITSAPSRNYDYYIMDTSKPLKKGLQLLADDDHTYLFVRDIDVHTAFNKISEKYPSRDKVSNGFFRDLFEINISYDNVDRNYFFY